jgi:hypothetical protein
MARSSPSGAAPVVGDGDPVGGVVCFVRPARRVRAHSDEFRHWHRALTEAEKCALAEASNADADLKREFALGQTDGAGKTLLEAVESAVAPQPGNEQLAHRRRQRAATTSLEIRLV